MQKLIKYLIENEIYDTLCNYYHTYGAAWCTTGALKLKPLIQQSLHFGTKSVVKVRL